MSWSEGKATIDAINVIDKTLVQLATVEPRAVLHFKFLARVRQL